MAETDPTFWDERAKKFPDAPCQYLSGQMDLYARKIKERVFFSKFDVSGKRVLDLGCGDGKWLKVFLEAGASYVFGAEKNEELFRLARTNVPEAAMLKCGAEEEWVVGRLRGRFDFVTMITTLNCIIPEEIRQYVFQNVAQLLSPDGRLVIIDYLPKRVPKYQRNMRYKKVWPLKTLRAFLLLEGLEVVDVAPLNWVDTSLFHYFGASAFVRVVTEMLDSLTRFVPKSLVKYRMVVCKRLQE